MAALWDLPAPEAGSTARPNAAGLGREELAALLAGMGEPAWRGKQLFSGLLRQRWTRWEQFSNLAKALRARLEAEVDLAWPAIIQSQSSADGSTKHVFELKDGKQVEGVHMPYAARGSGLRPTPPEPPRQTQAQPESGFEDLDRVTLCLSSQVGCAMGCTFCATGQMGIIRNLSAAEIVGQVVAMLNHHAHPLDRPVNLVFMGMGEPLHNFDHLMAAFATLTDPEGLAIPPRRITVSTSGLVSAIERLGTYARRPRLALSLNGTTDEHRSRIMPVNRVWNLEALASALSRFPLQSGERITLEYVLLKGVTDSLEDGRRLAAFARRFPAKVNLIPFNPHEGSGFEAPEESRISALCRLLSEADLPVSVRRSRGQDVAGACGQLVREGQSRHPKRI
ncbi:dual-specificity RNA methyltransferase RlmN [Geothrix limicola]|uniref:Probable dual-specificity RNA methyltransferase RlmN n=1 Tax=Geothrix limicola TaxID=2927978 RepID=A0ABQ5QIG9_9BACT|nr:23S rRNA (adenine(2503)-C(2))-methyltransferase RlmN [Geothrix limicola]GLH74373.1 dual-specificity RNA methyltransferase RlmN [Geothrix limicola]